MFIKNKTVVILYVIELNSLSINNISNPTFFSKILLVSPEKSSWYLSEKY